MKKVFSKNNLLRLKKLLSSKEAILILAALVVVIVFVLVRGGEESKPPARQNSGVPVMSESMGTPNNAPSMETRETPPPEPETPPVSDMGPPPESDEELQLPESEPPPDDTGENPTSVTPPPGATPSGIPPSDMPPSADDLPEPPDTRAEPPPATPSGMPPEASPETTPEATETSVSPPAVTPGSATSFEPPQSPTVSFKYIWSGSSFKPCADISWTAETAERIVWQLCGTNGIVLLEGEIQASGGGASQLNNYAFDTYAQSQNGLYPKGYTLKLIPHYSGGTLAPHVMELPYFEVTAQKIDGQLRPVIATNIGLYFVHSFESLTDTETGGKLRITGSLLPIEGVQTPLNIDVLSK